MGNFLSSVTYICNMFRWASFILSLMLFMGSIHNSILFLQFEVQQDYYASELCEQREIEGNDCQGQCQLKAILMGEIESNSTPPATPPYQEETLTFLDVHGGISLLLKGENLELKAMPIFNDQILLPGFYADIWHPPKF